MGKKEILSPFPSPELLLVLPTYDPESGLPPPHMVIEQVWDMSGYQADCTSARCKNYLIIW